MTDRTTLVIPAGQVGSLDVPPLALDDASSDVVWVEAPLGGLWGSQRIRVPLAARSVKSSSRFLLEFRWRPLIGWLVFAVHMVAADGYMQGLWGFVPQVVLGGLLGGWLVWASRRPRQLPYRTHLGEMVILQVSRETASRWVELNPGVDAIEDPVSRQHPPLMCAAWATVLIAVSLGVGTYLGNDGREQSLAVWATVAVVLVSGVRTAFKTMPAGFIRVEPRTLS